jgi:UDP-N-acetylglucosamine acyltransferase
VTVQGYPAKPHGTNNEGLRRRGFTADDILAVRRAYKILYREGLTLDEAKVRLVAAAEATPALAPLMAFLGATTRGIVR